MPKLRHHHVSNIKLNKARVAKPKYDLAESIIQVLREKGPMAAVDLLPHVSGTRQQVAQMVLALHEQDRIERVTNPNRVYSTWRAL